MVVGLQGLRAVTVGHEVPKSLRQSVNDVLTGLVGRELVHPVDNSFLTSVMTQTLLLRRSGNRDPRG